ncbi:MAG: TlpA disulfide reductase family protein [Paracoccaceae bacterium]|nr:TlpA disulfide reductase family protein [Paracoccaceae bacterium]
MNAVQFGPLVLGIDRFAGLAAIAAFLLLAWIAACLRPQVAARLRAWSGPVLVVGLIAARLGHVLGNWAGFAADPLRMFAVWQGGFSAQAGLVAALAFTAFAAGRGRGFAGPAFGAMALSLVLWQGILAVAGPVVPLQALAGRLETLDGAGFDLAEHRGRPMVLNLWATWCAPCRREMPMLAEVAASTDGITFAFANQREPASRVALYLATEGITLPNVIFDTDGVLARHYSSIGLPATLFLGADGKLAALHIGETSRERVMAEIARLLAQ